MYSSGHLDWLAMTFPVQISDQFTPVPLPDLDRISAGRHGYADLYASSNGAHVLAGGTDEMGVHLILPGATLQALRDDGYTDQQVVALCLQNSARASRLDLALDVFDSTLTVDKFERAYARDRIKTTAKSATRTYEVDSTGDTLYIGSRSSERMMRVYDKNAQLKIQHGPAWLRLEMELKKMTARAAAQVVAENQDTNTVTVNAIAQFAQWSNREYKTALRAPYVEFPDTPRTLPAFLRWFQDQVVPAAASYQEKHPCEDIIAMFAEMVITELERRAEGQDYSNV